MSSRSDLHRRPYGRDGATHTAVEELSSKELTATLMLNPWELDHSATIHAGPPPDDLDDADSFTH